MLDGRLQELRGLVIKQGGPRLMDLSLSNFLDVVWSEIVTPPAMADAHEWREVMFCWFHLGREPIYVNVYDPSTKRRSKKLAPREAQVASDAAVAAAQKIARGADANMERLRKRHEKNAELREERRQLVRAERLARIEESPPG